VTKTSVRLSPETCKKLESEAAKLGGESGTSVTVSDLIRACIDQKIPPGFGQGQEGNFSPGASAGGAV